jgi:hypothetical protein
VNPEQALKVTMRMPIPAPWGDRSKDHNGQLDQQG